MERKVKKRKMVFEKGSLCKKKKKKKEKEDLFVDG